jgi:hypothetical protein
MAPGIVRVDTAREHGQLQVDALEVLAVGLVLPGRRVADRHALVGAPGVGEVDGRVAGFEREAELAHEPGVGHLPLGRQLAAELHGAAIRQPFLLHSPAGTIARFEHQHVGSGERQVARAGQPGQPRPHHDDVPC